MQFNLLINILLVLHKLQQLQHHQQQKHGNNQFELHL